MQFELLIFSLFTHSWRVNSDVFISEHEKDRTDVFEEHVVDHGRRVHLQVLRECKLEFLLGSSTFSLSVVEKELVLLLDYCVQLRFS